MLCVYMLGPLVGACTVWCGNTQSKARMASSINSEDNIKRAIALALFGGESKNKVGG